MIVSVILDVKNRQCNKAFDYIVPKSLEDLIQIGCRVFVPFGNRKLMGFVVGICDENKSEYELKEIFELIDYEPILSEELINLGKELSEYYFSFLIEDYLMMIPNALKAEYKKFLYKHCDDLPKEVLDIFKNRNKAPLIDFVNLQKNIDELIKEKKLSISIEFKEKLSIKTKKIVSLLDINKCSSKKQKDIALYLQETKIPVEEKYLTNDMGYSISILKTMERNGAITISDVEVYREVDVREVSNKRVVLNDEQQNAYNIISQSFNKFDQFLIHGVCGSGKTEIYMNLIEKVIENGKQAIMLVPEISLTPQMASRFKARFSDNVAIIHSGLSFGEKYDEWRRIKRKEANIVVGARSALFVPMDNIGIIIMDEEQEESYIQDSNPKYDSHFVALKRATYHQCPLVLGSATPSVLTYYNALNGDIKLITLNKRANNKPLPKSYIANMIYEFKGGNRSVFSKALKDSLNHTLKNNEQAVLLINRRGYSTFVMCRSCGMTINCPHCDVSLTYHSFNNQLICHYCGYRISNVASCPNCSSPYIRFVGDGTQKVEEEINKLYPEAKVIRMDSDTTSRKNGHTEIIKAFEEREADILLGTQVVAKGLDFPGVSLVGIVNADLGLKMPFYDSYEKTYNLLEQASGRAGRKDTDGRVIIQTYNPDEYPIKAACVHNYQMFYENEIKLRKAASNPPFMDYVNIVISSLNKEKAYNEALTIVDIIKNQVTNAKVLGPTENYIFKIRDRYNYQITVKIAKEDSLGILSYINERYQSIKDVFISITRK